MTIRVALEHRTTYRFDRPVTVHPHVVRLRPAPHCRTPIDAYSLTVRPGGHFVNWQQDAFGNHQARLVFAEPVTELEIVVDLVADMTVINPFDFFLEDYAQHVPFAYPAGVRSDLEPYLRPVDEVAPGRPAPVSGTSHVPAVPRGSGPGPVLREWMAEWAPAVRDLAGTDTLRTVDFLVDVNQRVHRAVGYTVRMEPGVQTPDETLEKASGSCRDSAWLLASVLREMGLATRFVSGYLVQLEPDVRPLDGPGGPEHDFTDLHAWTEVYVPGAGWIGLDPTSGLFAGEGHIPLAATPHPATAAPITGSTSPCEVDFDFSNTVRRVHEDPRVTRPYTDGQWSRIQAVGWAVDGRLADGDVRLTMGGEPTFVSVDDMEAEEWNTAADGPQKRRLAASLAGRLFERWAPGGVLHHGQGKWYPGEPLPRWAIGLVWRTDGEPLWRDRSLLDTPWGPAVVPSGSAQAEQAVHAVAVGTAARLGIGEALCLPAYEDLLHDLWQEARRPWGEAPATDADPDDPDLADAASRKGRVDALDADPGTPAGWVVPLFRAEDDTRWASAAWRLRRKHLFLTPGTSPLGLRLPLDSVAWTPPPPVHERSPFEARGSLPGHPLPGADPETDGPSGPAGVSWASGTALRATAGLPVASSTPSGALGGVTPALIADQSSSPRTALAVEERDGHVFVFLPPLTHAEHALELLAAVEGAAAEAGVPVVLEGYPLPGDPRLRSMSVTPDPG
ncbi:MAG: transglutaminase family protein [Kineosporiaceae bacterium]